MSLWQGLGRIISGKPVFTTESSNGTQSVQNEEQTSQALVDAQGRKILPKVSITHVKPQVSGSTLEVWATIQNDSDSVIFLDKMHFLMQKVELDREIKPGEAHQQRIYRGPVLTDKPSDDADIQYRIQSNGDYFQARFMVEFYYQNQQYMPEDFHLEHPIRDV